MQTAFLPQTTLAPDQTRTNFTIFDNPVMDLLLSPEAEQACSKMWLIYARLKRADWKLWERPGVLYFGGDDYHTAWESACEIAGVASATLAKALQWMKKHNVIAYFARKNGAGIRIYFNLALNSIKPKQKNLTLVPTSSGSSPASFAEAPSWEDIVFPRNIQDSDLDASRASLPSDAPVATPAAEENTSNVVAAPVAGVELPAPVADSPAPVAPTKPTLALVPPVQPTSNVALQIAVVEALSRKVDELEQALREARAAAPSKDWLLNVLAGKVGRVAAETVVRMEGRKKPALNVGANAPELSAEAIAEYEASLREEAWKENALRALPPAEYEQRIAALIAAASSDPSYATLHRWTDEAKRQHFDRLLKRQLWEAQR